MYCPRCGLERASEEIRFCSRCGFQLTELQAFIERGGTSKRPKRSKRSKRLEQSQRPKKVKSPRRRGFKQAGWMAAVTLILVFVLASGDAVDEALSVAIIGMMLAGLRVLVGLALHWRQARKLALQSPDMPAHALHTAGRDYLPPAQTNPVDIAPRRFDTGEIVEPPSVTEHTTHHLRREPQRER